VTISGLKIVYGKVSAREIASVLIWAKDHQAQLMAKFEELQR
jgi:hypothetical protein